MTPADTCPRCGAALPDARSRPCPACLLAIAADPDITGVTTVTDGTSAGAPGASEFAPGQILGAYRIERVLGYGGMGTVYEAEQLEHGRRVALKVIARHLAGTADRERFLREGQLAASVTHPHVVYIFGSETIAGAPVITMELLPGGTLKDRVERDGPLATAEAVDAILQVIGGLDAAYHAGILHRDVKPSNCFIDFDGLAKIGDFGLSISTQGRYPDALTERGGIQGTPQFASPEQLAGEPLDVRTDIYAVGATLYYLLTGHAPFEAADLRALLPKVAAERAVFPKHSRVARGLAALVLQCLDKRPGNRPSSYRELYDALEPFGSAAPRAAGALSRICAFYVDVCIVSLVSVIVRELVSLDRWYDFASFGIPALFVLTVGIPLVYFAVVEGFFRRSVGKALFGLRVTTVDGTPPTTLAVAARAALFMTAVFVVERTLMVLGWPLLLMAWFGLWLQALVVFVTARGHNGLAGLHDLVTGTRVTVGRTAEATQRPARSGSPDPAEGRTYRRRGPFAVLDPITSHEGAVVSGGWDVVLRRPVWILETPPGSPLVAVRRRVMSRPTRLRWLAGREEADGTWQAFAAATGEPFVHAIARYPPWHVVRGWVASLAGEIRVARAEGNLPRLELDRVWVTPQRIATLAEFPVAARAYESGRDVRRGGVGGTAGFLLAVAGSGQSGVAGKFPQVRASGGPPLPVGDRTALAALRAVDEPDATDLANLQEALLTPRTSVRRGTRVVIPALVALLAAASLIQSAGQPRQFAHMTSDWALFNGLAEIERFRRMGVPPSAPEREALEMYLAARYQDRLTLAAVIYPHLLRTSRDVASRRAGLSAADLVAAAERLGSQRLNRLNYQLPHTSPHLLVRARVWLLTIFGAIAVLVALVFREGPILRAQNIAIVGDDGVEVSRPRAAGRALMGWSPIFVHWLLPLPLGPGDATWSSVMALALLALAVTGVWRAAVRPERGIHDQLAGTWLVPR